MSKNNSNELKNFRIWGKEIVKGSVTGFITLFFSFIPFVFTITQKFGWLFLILFVISIYYNIKLLIRVHRIEKWLGFDYPKKLAKEITERNLGDIKKQSFIHNIWVALKNWYIN